MPAPELVGQSSVKFDSRDQQSEWGLSLKRSVVQCGASCVNDPEFREANLRTHSAWAPHVFLGGGIARTGCRTRRRGNVQGFDTARTCTPVDRNDPDSWDGKILTDCVGCGCQEIGLNAGGVHRGIGYHCRLGFGVMLWTNDQDVAGITGDPDAFPGFNPNGQTWGLTEYDVFKPRGCTGFNDCRDPCFQSPHVWLRLRGCGCCYDWDDPLRCCERHVDLPTCSRYVNSDCAIDIPGVGPSPDGGKCLCVGDPGGFECNRSDERVNAPYWAERWCQRGIYIGRIRVVGLLRGVHQQVDDNVVRRNWEKFWLDVQLDYSQFCQTHDWGRFVGATGHNLTVRHRLSDKGNGFVRLALDPLEGFRVDQRDWIFYNSDRSGFQDWPEPPTDARCAQYMGANRNGNFREGPFPFGRILNISGIL